VHIKTQPALNLHNLKYLPSYAGYLLKNRLRQYSEHILQLSRQLNLPVLKALDGISDEQLMLLGIESSKVYLSYLAQNKAEEQIEASLIRWIKNQLPVIDKKDVGAEDITLMTYIRKNTFLYFISEYYTSTKEIVALVGEIDIFLTSSETEATILILTCCAIVSGSSPI